MVVDECEGLCVEKEVEMVVEGCDGLKRERVGRGEDEGEEEEEEEER